MTEQSMNEISDLYDNDPSVRFFVEALATSPEVPTMTSADELTQTVPNITRQQAVSLVQAFAAIGAGDYIVGRRKSPTRIEWKVNAQRLAERIVMQNTQKRKPIEIEDRMVAQWSPTLMLRPGILVQIQGLPETLTQEESERLQALIKLIPTSK